MQCIDYKVYITNLPRNGYFFRHFKGNKRLKNDIFME